MLLLGAGLAARPIWRLRAQTSSARVRRVGVFTPGMPATDEALSKPFYEEMRHLGWIEGENVAYDRVYGNDRMEMLPQLAEELVGRRPDLILAASPPTSRAAKRATSSIPIIFTAVVDPLVAGLVASLARPGGNVTGVTQSIADSLAPKRLQLLLEILPGVKRIGLLSDPADPGAHHDQMAMAPLVGAHGLTMIVANATDPVAFEGAVANLVEQRVQAIFPASSLAISRRDRLIELTDSARIPVVGLNFPMADAGALFSFGPSLADQIRRSAHLADKVLRGAKPADIPVEAATLFELVVNLKSARVLGIKIPQSILLRADRVIQ